MPTRVRRTAAPAVTDAGTAVEVPARAPRVRDASLLAAVAAALSILALFTVLHLVRIGDTPGWDPQEGYNLDIAWNLLHGRLRMFALTADFGQHPPLFYLQLATLIRLCGYHITVLRGLAAGYAIMTCAAVLGFGWHAFGRRAALWGGLVFCAAPLFLDNTRWGYSYAQLMFFGVCCLWALWHARQRTSLAWLLVAATLAGICVLSDYEGVAFVLMVLGIAWHSMRDKLALAASLAVGIPLAGIVAYAAVAPTLFLADFSSTAGRASGSSLVLSALMFAVNYYRFATLDVWVLLGLVGLFLAAAPGRRWLIASIGLLALIVLKVREIGPAFHTAVPLIPYLALGAGVALDAALRKLYAGSLRALRQQPDLAPAAPALTLRVSAGANGRTSRALRTFVRARWRTSLAALVVFVVVVSPVAIALATDAAGLASTLSTPNDAIVATSPADAQAVAAYVLARARPGDVILGSPQIVWQLDQPDDVTGHPRPIYGADLLQSVAVTGEPAAFYPAELPPSRWAFDVSLRHARYVIVDSLVRELAQPSQVAGLAQLLAEAESWPAVYQRGEYTVYQRPD